MSDDDGENHTQGKTSNAADYKRLLLRCLESGDPEAFNAWRETNPSKLILVQGEKFHSRQFKGFRFENVAFKQTEFFAVKFYDCGLVETSFDECTLNACQIRNSNLAGTRMQGTEAINIEFHESDLRFGDFRGVRFHACRISRCDLSGASFDDASLSRADIRDSAGQGIRFGRANFSDARLEGCDFSACDFRSANLTEAKLSDCVISGIKVWNVQLGGWRLRNIECSNASFDEDGERTIDFLPHQFERIYGNSLRVGLTFEGGLHLAELLAIPAIIESIRREFPDCSIGISSINEIGTAAEVIVTARPITAAAQSGLDFVKARLEGRLLELRTALQSRDREIDRLQASLMTLTQQLVDKLGMTKQSLTFNAPVIAGVIGGDAAVDGSFQVGQQAHGTSLDTDKFQAMLRQLSDMAEALDKTRRDAITSELTRVAASPSERSLREAGHSIRNICEGIAGSLAASGIIAKLAEFGLL